MKSNYVFSHHSLSASNHVSNHKSGTKRKRTSEVQLRTIADLYTITESGCGGGGGPPPPPPPRPQSWRESVESLVGGDVYWVGGVVDGV